MIDKGGVGLRLLQLEMLKTLNISCRFCDWYNFEKKNSPVVGMTIDHPESLGEFEDTFSVLGEAVNKKKYQHRIQGPASGTMIGGQRAE